TALGSTPFPYTTLFRSDVPGLGGRGQNNNEQLGPQVFLLYSRKEANGRYVVKVKAQPNPGVASSRLRNPHYRVPNENFVLVMLRSEEHTSELQSRGHLV